MSRATPQETHVLGSQLIIRTLHRLGVRTIFSLSGNPDHAAVRRLYRLGHPHRPCAARGGGGYGGCLAQMTGELGVAMLTAARPDQWAGAAVCGVAGESPVLLISGDSSVAEDGGRARSRSWTRVAITRAMTKLSLRPMSVGNCIPRWTARWQALAPRRGPVHLALPFDLLTAETGAGTAAGSAAAHRAVRYGRWTGWPRCCTRAASAGAGRPERRALACARRLPAAGGGAGPACHPMESPRGLKDPSLGALAAVIPDADLIVLAGSAWTSLWALAARRRWAGRRGSW